MMTNNIHSQALYRCLLGLHTVRSAVSEANVWEGRRCVVDLQVAAVLLSQQQLHPLLAEIHVCVLRVWGLPARSDSQVEDDQNGGEHLSDKILCILTLLESFGGDNFDEAE